MGVEDCGLAWLNVPSGLQLNVLSGLHVNVKLKVNVVSGVQVNRSCSVGARPGDACLFREARVSLPPGSYHHSQRLRGTVMPPCSPHTYPSPWAILSSRRRMRFGSK